MCAPSLCRFAPVHFSFCLWRDGRVPAGGVLWKPLCLCGAGFGRRACYGPPFVNPPRPLHCPHVLMSCPNKHLYQAVYRLTYRRCIISPVPRQRYCSYSTNPPVPPISFSKCVTPLCSLLSPPPKHVLEPWVRVFQPTFHDHLYTSCIRPHLPAVRVEACCTPESQKEGLKATQSHATALLRMLWTGQRAPDFICFR